MFTRGQPVPVRGVAAVAGTLRRSGLRLPRVAAGAARDQLAEDLDAIASCTPCPIRRLSARLAGTSGSICGAYT